MNRCVGVDEGMWLTHPLVLPQHSLPFNTKRPGARGGSRTHTVLPPLDFESSTSTSFITRANRNS